MHLLLLYLFFILVSKLEYFSKAIAVAAVIISGALRLLSGAIEHRLQVTLNDYELGRTNMAVLMPKILEIPQIASADARLDEFLTSQRVIWYGAGRNAADYLPKMKAMGLRMPDEIWDISAGSQGGSLQAASEFLGCPLRRPAFDELDLTHDAVIISIENGTVNQELAQLMRGRGFARFMPYYDFSLAYMVKKQLRQNAEAAENTN